MGVLQWGPLETPPLFPEFQRQPVWLLVNDSPITRGSGSHSSTLHMRVPDTCLGSTFSSRQLPRANHSNFYWRFCPLTGQPLPFKPPLYFLSMRCSNGTYHFFFFFFLLLSLRKKWEKKNYDLSVYLCFYIYA